MSLGPTLPHPVTGLSIRALAVEVVAGPDAGKRVQAKSDVLTVGGAHDNDLVLNDETVSRYHFELRRIVDRIWLEDNGSTNGVEAGGVLIKSGVVRPGSILRCGKTKLRVDDAEPVTLEVTEGEELHGALGRAPVMRRLFSDLERAARSHAPVLLLGETGTGKELMARAVHESSPRASGPFEIVDCGTLQPALISSELFGHEKGAFTGAVSAHTGAFERANGGTVFLDEIGELPDTIQPALLGVLERKSFRRVGGNEPVSVDVRVVAATHRDLRAAVNTGHFRQDLYFRLAVVCCRVPALRERAEDIPLLIDRFLAEAGHDGPVDDMIDAKTMVMLKRHSWPGNVRELRNFVEVTLALGRGPELIGAATPGGAHVNVPSELSALLDQPYSEARGAWIEGFERAYVQHLLERSEGNVSKASRLAEMNRSYLRQLVDRHKRRGP